MSPGSASYGLMARCRRESASAHFCAAVPNLRIMEIEIDDVPWKDELVTHVPVIENGALVLSDRPGWGTEVNEDAIRAYAPKQEI